MLQRLLDVVDRPHGMPALPMTASQCAVVLAFSTDSISRSSLP